MSTTHKHSVPANRRGGNDEKLFTLAEIARRFRLPDSTARYYCKRFADFMVTYGEGRRRRYRKESLCVLATVVEHMQQGKNAADIEIILASLYPRTTEALVTRVPVPSSRHTAESMSEEHAHATAFAPAHMPAQTPSHVAPQSSAMGHDTIPAHFAMQMLEQQNIAMQSIAHSLNALVAHQQDVQELANSARTAAEENIALRKEVDVLKSLLHTAEQVHQDDLGQVRTWMSRLARSYNANTGLNPQPDTEDASSRNK